MKYIKVAWRHTFPDEPTLLYSEVDENGWEQRKVYFFRNGPPGFASSMESTRSVVLGEKPLPPISEIAADPQFSPEEIGREEFEEIWIKAWTGAP